MEKLIEMNRVNICTVDDRLSTAALGGRRWELNVVGFQARRRGPLLHRGWLWSRWPRLQAVRRRPPCGLLLLRQLRERGRQQWPGEGQRAFGGALLEEEGAPGLEERAPELGDARAGRHDAAHRRRLDGAQHVDRLPARDAE